MVVYIKEFFETLTGASFPDWFYNTLGLLITLCFVRGMLEMIYPKLSKHVDFILTAVILGYIAYEVLPVWGIAIKGGA